MPELVCSTADTADTADPAAALMDAAIAIARNAPLRRGTYVSHAKIYWPFIEDLRAQLEALGVEWRDRA